MKMLRDSTVPVGLVLAVLLAPLSSWAAVYHVSSSGGDDTSSGTAEAPWKTIARVNTATFAPGDEILFRRGDTFRDAQLEVPSSGASADARITFGAYGPGDKPVLDGAGLPRSAHCVRSKGKNWIAIQDLRLQGAPASGIRVNQGGHILIQRCEVTNVGNGGIYFVGSADDAVHDVVVQDCVIHDLVGQSDGIVVHNGANATQQCGANFIFRRNRSTGCKEQGFDLTSGSHILLEHNFTSGNDQGGMTIGHTARDVTVRYHRSENEPAKKTAATLMISVPDVTVEYSTFIGSSAFAQPVVLIQSGVDGQPEDIVLRNNVFVWNSAADGDLLRLQRNYTRQPPLAIQRLTMRNNIWASRTGGRGTMNFAEDRAPDHAGFVIDHNLYHQPGGARWRVAGTECALADYRKTYGRDAHGREGDPLFVDPAGGDFHLSTAGSPARDAGENSGLAQDGDGVAVPQGGDRDIGAFEFSSHSARP
jgi:hypothetical protein